MRLTQQQCSIIRASVQDVYGDDATVWLFGLRLDDSQRGGDIDLLIEIEQNDIDAITRTEIALLTILQMKLGEQKFDILLDYPVRKFHPPIFDIARQQGKCQRNRHYMAAALGLLANSLPLTGDAFGKLNEDNVHFLDRFIFRFSQLQEAMGHRLLRRYCNFFRSRMRIARC